MEIKNGLFLSWSDGDVRYFNGTRLRDMGYFECKEQIIAWCEANGVRFLEHLPQDPATFVWRPVELPRVKGAGRSSKRVLGQL